MPDVGDQAPDFSALDQHGRRVSLSDFHGQSLLLYFYPKDDTPGCTTQACNLRDQYAQVGDTRAAVVGVSKDGVASHLKFAQKYDLPFPLLADEDGAICAAYDVIQEKMNYGRKYLGIERTTYLIDGDGVIRHKWAKVKVDGHADRALTALREMAS